MARIENLDLEGLRGGDRTVFNQVFTFYWNDILAFCVCRLDKLQDAEEITLDIFMRLWKKRQTIQSPKHLRKLLYKIAKGKVSNQWRDRGRQKIKTDELGDNDHDIPVSLQTNPSIEDVTRELDSYFLFWGELALKEMEQLPPRCREALRMHLIENKKPAEIAEILKISPDTVDSHVNYALKLLKKTLLKHGYNNPWTILWAVLLFFLK